MESSSSRLSSEARTIRGSLSLSSISMSSKNLLSFSKSKRSNPSLRPQVSQSSLSRVEETTQTASTQPPLRPETRPLQGTAPRRLSNRDSNAILYNGKRTSVQRRTSNRAFTASPSPKSRVATTRLWTFGRRELSVGRPGSPIGQSPSPSPTNAGSARALMLRFKKRPQDPRTSEDDDPAALPIQRAPSARSVRRPTPNRAQIPKRSSRNSSLRSSSVYRPQSNRSSRTRSSGVMTPGYSFPPRPPSSLLGSRHDVILDEGDLSDSSFTSESEEEDPITMRNMRLDRVRGGASSHSSHTTTTQDTIIRAPMVSNLSPLADLIEEVAGEIEGRPSRDTMYSVMTSDTSLDHYFDAFPAPPSPGKLPGATIHTSSLSINGLLAAINPSSQNSSVDFTSRTASTFESERPNFRLDLFSQTTTNVSYQSISSALPSPSTQNTSSSQGDYLAMALHRGRNESLASIRESMEQQAASMSSASPPPTSPTSSRGTPLPRSRSTDPMAQARRRTRVVFGQFVDASEDIPQQEDMDVIEGPEIYVNLDRRDTADTLPTPTLTESQSAPSRRGSAKSSTSSLLFRHSGQSYGNLLSPSVEDSYSLNSPDSDHPNVGIAMMNETRSMGRSSPTGVLVDNVPGYSSLEDTKPSLFDRRKVRNQTPTAPLSLLRLESQAPTQSPLRPIQHDSPSVSPSLSPSGGEVASGASSSTNTATSSPVPTSVEAAILTPNIRNQFVVGLALPGPPAPAPVSKLASAPTSRASPAPSPPPSVPPTPSTTTNPTSAPSASKRKSFFRTSFFSRRKQNRVSPPPPSPVARAPPMSASAKSTTFFPNDVAQQVQRAERAQTARPIRSNHSVTSVPTFARAQYAQNTQYPEVPQLPQHSQQAQHWQQFQPGHPAPVGYPSNPSNAGYSGFPSGPPRTSRRPATAPKPSTTPRPSTAPHQQSSYTSYSRPSMSFARQQSPSTGPPPANPQDSPGSLGRRFRQGMGLGQREAPIQESDDRQRFQVAYAT